MASIYENSGSSGGSVYENRGGGKKPKQPTGGVLGFVEHLGTDVKDMAVGIPSGLLHTVEHPIGTAKAVASIYENTYGHGFHHFIHDFYAHPLGPLMDVAAIATLPFGIGEGIAGSRVVAQLGRIGVMDAEKGALVRGSRAMQEAYKTRTLKGARSLAAEGKLKDVESALSSSGHHHFLDQIDVALTGKLPRRYVGHQLDQLLKRFPAETKYIGELSRFGRQIDQAIKRGPRSLGLRIGEFNAAYKRLTDEEKAAWHLKATGTSPAEYQQLLHTIDEERGPAASRTQMIETLDSPELRAAYDSIGKNPRLDHALDTGRQMSEALDGFRLNLEQRHLREQIGRAGAALEEKTQRLTSAGPITKQNAKKIEGYRATHDAAVAKAEEAFARSQRLLEERPFLHMRMVRGARFAETFDSPGLRRAADKIEKARASHEKLLKTDEEWVAKQNPALPFGSKPHEANLTLAGHELERATAAHARLEQSLATRWTEGDVNALRELHNQPQRAARDIMDTDTSSVAAIRAELEARGESAPFYAPDISTDAQMKPARQSFATAGGKGPDPFARDPRWKQNQGVLFTAGKLALDPQTLGDAFYEFGRRQYLQAIHDELVASAVRTDKLPDVRTWVWIKENSRERLPTTASVRGDAGQALADIVERNERNVTHLAVPKDLVEKLTEEFTRSDKFIRMLWERPTTVWRAIILHLRVGYLTNNAIGQWFFTLFHYGLGPDMLQAWSSYIREVHPRVLPEWNRMIRQYVLRQNVAPLAKREFRTIKEKYVPQEVYGTQQRAQGVGGDVTQRQLPGKVMEKTTSWSRGIAPANSLLTEDIPRELAMRFHVIRNARRMGLKIETDAKRFNELADQVLSHPHIADEAVKEANRALGDYMTMNNFERNVVRQLMPFYGWFREIARISFNTAVDTPGRTIMLLRLGQIGADWAKEHLGELPEYLRSLVPIFGGTVNTHSSNPYASLADDINAAGGLLGGKPGNTGKAMGSLLSPFIVGIVNAMTGSNLVTGRPVEKTPIGGGIGPVFLWNQIAELPPSRFAAAVVGHGAKSKTFGQADSQRAFLDYLGLPFRPKPRVRG